MPAHHENSRSCSASAVRPRRPRAWRWLLVLGLAALIYGIDLRARRTPAQPVAACAMGAAARLAAAPSNAGCMLKADGRLLAVRDRLSGRWGFPGGRPQGEEPPACTAVREVREETGVAATAVTVLAVYRGDFVLFGCTAAGLSAAVTPEVPPGATGRGEILEIAWIDIAALDARAWRFPDQVTDVRARFAAFSP